MPAGRPYKYSPKELQKLFENYVTWNNTENKFYRRELLKGGEHAGKIVDIDLTPPLTIVGFCVFIEVHKATFFDWINDSTNELHDIATYIREQIEQNQISGASLDLFNPSIVARLNGLTDTLQVESNQQPVINIALPNFVNNFGNLSENNVENIEFEAVKPLELTEINIKE